MELTPTKIPGLLIVKPKVFKDARGYFLESYNQVKFEDHGLHITFCQDNESRSTQGVIRGLHYQLEPHAQTKLMRVLDGIIYDVAVDLRKGSPTFGQWHGERLSSENKKQLLIPKGFAHGFSVISEHAVVAYKCDNMYSPQSERGIAFNDPTLAIDWQVPIEKALISPKDLKNPLLKDAEFNFIFKNHD